MLPGCTSQLGEARRAGATLGDPFPRECPAADVGEQPAHLRPHRRTDHAIAACEVAVLGGVADRVAHEAETTAVDQIHDQLQLVQTLEVGHFRGVAGLGERVEARLHQRGDTATQHRLLAEQIGLRLLGEGGADDAGARAPDPGRVRERVRQRRAAGILMHRDQRGHAAPRLVLAAD